MAILSDYKLPPTSTIESHFKPNIDKIEKEFTNPNQLVNLLDEYWHIVESAINKNSNEPTNSIKLNVCISSNAALLISFSSKRKKSKKKKEIKN